MSVCVSAGLNLRRMRNHRGLKAFQLARANGHSSIARQLCDTRSTRARRDRRRRNAEGSGGAGGGGGGGVGRSTMTPEALLTMLIQVAQTSDNVTKRRYMIMIMWQSWVLRPRKWWWNIWLLW